MVELFEKKNIFLIRTSRSFVSRENKCKNFSILTFMWHVFLWVFIEKFFFFIWWKTCRFKRHILVGALTAKFLDFLQIKYELWVNIAHYGKDKFLQKLFAALYICLKSGLYFSQARKGISKRKITQLLFKYRETRELFSTTYFSSPY